MRASILVLGPLLARFGEARVSLPGGCAIGLRPVDQHIKGLQAMGAEIDIEHGYIHATAQRLKGARIVHGPGDRDRHREPDDGGGAGRGHDGASRMPRASRRWSTWPTVSIAMGAQHRRAGHRRDHHRGRRPRCTARRYRVMPDRIETGTFLVAAAATGGEIRLQGHACPTSSTRC